MPQSRSKVYKTVLRLKNTGCTAWNLIEKGPKKYRFRCSASKNLLRRPNMVADIFEEFEPPSKSFLSTPLLPIWEKSPGRSQNKKMIAKIQTSRSKALVAHKNGDMYLYKYIWRSLTKAVPDPNVLYLTETLCNHCFRDIWSWRFNLYVYENNAPIIHHLNGIDPGIETLGVGTCDLETRTLRIELVTHRLLVSWD